MKHTFDNTTRPQDDFFGYVNNKWLANNPIPRSENSWGTFYVLRDNSWKAVSDIIEHIRAKNDIDLSSNQIIVKRFLTSALEFTDHEQAHTARIKSELKKITDITDHDELASYLGYSHRHDLNIFWSPYVELDDKNSQMQVLRIHQGGLGMPNRDYYLETSTQMKKFRAAYETYQNELRSASGVLADISNETVFSIETEIAKASWTDIELRDVEKNYNHFTLSELTEYFTGFNWTAYFDGLGWQSPSDHVVVGQPSFIEATLTLIKTQPLESIKHYLAWRLVSGFANWTSSETYEASFAFYETALGGVTEKKPLWKRAVMLADTLVIGELLGHEYAAKHFPESSKHEVLELVEAIRSAYHTRIDRLTWMQDKTKARAHTKLDNIKVFIGYPSIWRDVSSLKFTTDDLVSNILTARAHENEYQLAKIGMPPAQEEWEMHAHTVNAYHHPNRLEIVFPAAILQPPFYDPAASYAANLGGIGAVIGHEFTHGFDDQGAQFDETGNVVAWQSDEERAAFATLANLIVKQGDGFETVPGTFLQGKLILGEAIADIGGLQLAVEALAKTDSSPADYRDLFVNFAVAECGHATSERLIQLAKIDPHPPSPFRVNCVVNHIDAFYESYDVEQTDKLYRHSDARAQIW